VTCLSSRAWISREARDPSLLVNCGINALCLYRYCTPVQPQFRNMSMSCRWFIVSLCSSVVCHKKLQYKRFEQAVGGRDQQGSNALI